MHNPVEQWARSIEKLILEILAHRGAYARFVPLSNELQTRVAESPEVQRWLEHQCPLCGDPLFVFTGSDTQTEWCSRERLHFELERHSLPNWKANGYETEVAVRISI
jgi:hypothetical protein